MNIRMAGIDYSMAGIEIREQFSLTKSAQREVYRSLRQDRRILGAVLVSTCNRTELYLSCEAGYEPNPFEILCHIVGQNYEDYALLHKMRSGDDVFWHLSQMACGAKSQIWGEDQIITQVKNSLQFARENQGTDAYLEVLFRMAITAAKKIKTTVAFSRSDHSIADKTLALLQKAAKPVRRVLVIGTGEVGKLVARTLTKAGFSVTMTLRQYKHAPVEIPPNVDVIEYSRRYERISEFDALVSATLSPHYTIERAKVEGLGQLPHTMVDLALPRDIEVSIGEMEGISLADVDSIAGGSIDENHTRQMEEMKGIIEKYLTDYHKWYQYKERQWDEKDLYRRVGTRE